MPERVDFPDRERQAAALAAAVAADLRAAIAARGSASLAVPGGTTPASFLSELSRERLDWTTVRVTLTDERCVPAGSPRSNQTLLAKTLLQGAAAQARVLPLYGEASDESACAKALERNLLPLDVCVAGMGEDGHTASLFPGADRLDAALAEQAPPLLRLTAPGAPEARVSLSAEVIRQARKAYVLIAGRSKLGALERALTEGALAEAPIRVVLRRSLPTAIYYAA